MTERVEQNLYVDKQEICNLDYLEFLFWTAQVYGKDAETYKKLLPNENIWDASTPFLGDSVLRFYETFATITQSL